MRYFSQTGAVLPPSRIRYARAAVVIQDYLGIIFNRGTSAQGAKLLTLIEVLCWGERQGYDHIH